MSKVFKPIGKFFTDTILPNTGPFNTYLGAKLSGDKHDYAMDKAKESAVNTAKIGASILAPIGLAAAAPAIGGALSGLGGGGLSSILGTAAGTPLAGGIGPTAGSGILGTVTKAASSIPGLSSVTSGLSSSFTGGGMSNPLSSIIGGFLNQRTANKQKDEILNQLSNVRNEYAPYREAGQQASNRLTELLAPGSDFGATTAPFSAETFQEDPGYQFRLSEGEKSLNRRLASGGNYFSGDALKALQGYSQGLASQEYQDAFNRYNTEAQRKAEEEAKLYNMLYGQQGLGYNTAGALSDTYREEALAKAAAREAKDNALSRILEGGMSLIGGFI